MDDAEVRLDRYMAGELPRADERELARAALDDAELFDALMTAGAMRAALRIEGAGGAPTEDHRGPATVLRFVRRPLGAAAMAAAAAALVVAAVHPWRKAAVVEPAAVAPAAASPGASSAALHVPSPAILTARLEDLAGVSTTEFRAASAPSRAPKGDGALLSRHEDEVVVALGSLDGITQGARLEIFRGSDRTRPIARMIVSTVFREQSRGRVETAAARAGDVAVVPPALVAAAERQRMVALVAAGDVAGARGAGERARSQFADGEVAASDQRMVFAMLGALERREGDRVAAIEHLRSAVALFDRTPASSADERTSTLTELGAALLDAHNVDEAETAFRSARQTATGAAIVRVDNNLGAAAALRGDRAAAERFYRSALQAAATSTSANDDRRAIEKNLADLAAVR